MEESIKLFKLFRLRLPSVPTVDVFIRPLRLFFLSPFVLVIIFSNYEIAAGTTLEAKYSSVGASLIAPLSGGDGWRQDGDLSSVGSQFSARLSWGKEWYKGIGVKLFSSTSPLPLTIDTKDIASGVQSITGILGIETSPVNIAYSHRKFHAIGVVTEADKLRRNNVPLDPGEHLEFGSTVDLLTLRWLFDFGLSSLFLKSGYLGGGIGNISTKGIKGVNLISGTDNEFEFGSVETINESNGVVLEFRISGLPRNHPTKGTHFYMNYDVEWYISGNFGDNVEYYKQGTTLGILFFPWENISFQVFGGAYKWQIATPQKGFQGVQTTTGLEGAATIGVEW